MTQLTPRLADPTRAVLLARLTEFGMPEVAQNSVELGLTAVLGFEPKSAAFTYSQPCEHLPKVEARAEPGALGCARVDALVSLDKPALRLQVRGTYCLVGAAVWRSVDQVVTRAVSGA